MNSRHWSALAAALALVLLASCQDPSSIAGTEDALAPSFSSSTAQQPRRARVTFDDRLALLADQVPGFGGYFEQDGQLVIRLKSGTSTPTDVRTALADHFLSGTRASPGMQAAKAQQAVGATVLESEFDFRELYNWYRLVNEEVWPLGGINWSDIDERANKIAIGVRDQDKLRIVEAVVARLPIPASAITIVHAPGRFVLDGSTDLSGTVNPRISGAQVSVTGDSVGSCTLGYSVDRPQDSNWYFVTAAHCTSGDGETIGTVEGETFGQPDTTGTSLGYEVADPPTFTSSTDPDCESGYECRYSDVALIRYTTSTYQHGMVAWPSEGSRSFTNKYRIGGSSNPSAGAEVHKIGRTSGMTTGDVDRTCAKIDFDSIDRNYLCVAVADYDSDPGDSGAPVIDMVYILNYPRAAVGIHLGRNPDNGSEAVFSMHHEWVDELEDDYGGTYCVTIYCSPDPSVSIVSGPTTLPSGLLCTWEASASGGVTPYSYSWSGVASGSGSSLDAIVNSSGWLTVTVTDDVSHTDSDSVYITIDENEPEPPGCSELP